MLTPALLAWGKSETQRGGTQPVGLGGHVAQTSTCQGSAAAVEGAGRAEVA